MARFVRFIVHQRIRGDARRLGLFSAAYYLRNECELPQYDRERLEQLLDWFAAELTVPPKGAIPNKAIFWYKDVGSFSHKMWELVEILRYYGFTPELITAKSIGRVVYQDSHQCAALPSKRAQR